MVVEHDPFVCIESSYVAGELSRPVALVIKLSQLSSEYTAIIAEEKYTNFSRSQIFAS